MPSNCYIAVLCFLCKALFVQWWMKEGAGGRSDRQATAK